MYFRVNSEKNKTYLAADKVVKDIPPLLDQIDRILGRGVAREDRSVSETEPLPGLEVADKVDDR